MSQLSLIISIFLIAILSEVFTQVESLKPLDLRVKDSKILYRTYIPRYETTNFSWGENFTDFTYRKLAGNFSMKKIKLLSNSDPVPEYFDWRDKNMVSPVKNQGRCRACWAFSAIANIESHLKIWTNQELLLSEQFLIDCYREGGGCQGGASLLKVFSAIVTELGGVLQNQNYYPYNESQNKCRYSGPPPYLVPVVGMHRVPSDEDAMVQYLYNYGPLSAAINSKSMDNYTGHYIDEPTEEDCPSTDLDHTVLIVGYNVYVHKDTGKQVPYWIIKNSWGTNWGDGGFYYLVRGRNACGIASDVSFAVVK